METRHHRRDRSLIVLKISCGIDLGCAGGYFVKLMHDYGKNVLGVDLSAYAINASIKEFPEIKDKLFVSSLHDLKFLRDESIDFVYSQQVLEHIPTELNEMFFKELSRICQKGCKLALFLVLGYENLVAKDYNDIDKTHWNLKTKKWWLDNFEKYGFIEDVNLEKDMCEKLKETKGFQSLHRIILKKI